MPHQNQQPSYLQNRNSFCTILVILRYLRPSYVHVDIHVNVECSSLTRHSAFINNHQFHSSFSSPLPSNQELKQSSLEFNDANALNPQLKVCYKSSLFDTRWQFHSGFIPLHGHFRAVSGRKWIHFLCTHLNQYICNWPADSPSLYTALVFALHELISLSGPLTF